MPIGAALPAIIGAGSSIGSALLGRPKSGQQSFSQTSRSTPIYGPGQEKINNLVFRQLKRSLKSGAQIPEWMRTEGREQINDVYNATLERLRNAAAQRGFDASGVAGRESQNVELARAGGMRSFERDLTRDAMNRLMEYITAGMQFAQPRGQETVTSGTGPTQSVGQALAPSVGAIGSDIATQLLLRRLLNQQSAPAALPTGNLNLSGVLQSFPGYR